MRMRYNASARAPRQQTRALLAAGSRAFGGGPLLPAKVAHHSGGGGLGKGDSRITSGG